MPHYTRHYVLLSVLMLLAIAACQDVADERSAIPYGDVTPPDRDISRTDIPTDLPGDTVQPDIRPDQPPPDVRPDVPPDLPPPDVRPDLPPDLTDVPDVTVECRSDLDCPFFDRPFCDPNTERCVACLVDSQCPGNAICRDGRCRPGMNQICNRDFECPGFPSQVCDNFADPFSQGRCIPSCFPWPPDVPTSCGLDEWCRPSLTEPELGGCVPSVPMGAPDGSTCSPQFGSFEQAGCADGSLCLPSFSTFETECSRLCEIGTPPPINGCLDPQDSCVPLVFDEGNGQTLETAYGTCTPGCDWDAGVGCQDPQLECARAELFQIDDDICVETPVLDPLADCLAFGLNEGELCGGNSACFDLGPIGINIAGVRCWDFCVGTPQNPVGSANHPDCRTADNTCQGLFGEPNLGLCIPNVAP